MYLSSVAILWISAWSTAAASPNPRAAPVPYEVQTPPLTTPWTYKVGTNPWPEHPRPQLKREAWQNLNGIWTWQPAAGDDPSDPPSGQLANEIMVPSCVESGLSGIQQLNVTNMWYSTTFDVPHDWSGQSVVLTFEAVDYQATVFVNGKKAASHTGGYFRFTADVTKYLKPGEKNDL